MELFFAAYIVTGFILMWIDRDKKVSVKAKVSRKQVVELCEEQSASRSEKNVIYYNFRNEKKII